MDVVRAFHSPANDRDRVHVFLAAQQAWGATWA